MSKTRISDQPATESASVGAVATKAAPAGTYLTTIEAALYLKVSKSFLDKGRVYGNGPPFVRPGPRKILYRRADLDAWMAERRFKSTSQYGSR